MRFDDSKRCITFEFDYDGNRFRLNLAFKTIRRAVVGRHPGPCGSVTVQFSIIQPPRLFKSNRGGGGGGSANMLLLGMQTSMLWEIDCAQNNDEDFARTIDPTMNAAFGRCSAINVSLLDSDLHNVFGLLQQFSLLSSRCRALNHFLSHLQQFDN